MSFPSTAAAAGTRGPRDPRTGGMQCLQRSVEFHWSDPDLDLLRASVATITSYLFFNREECGACAERGDIVVDENFITLLLRHEKGKNALGAGRRNVRQIPCNVVPRIAALLRAFLDGQHSMEGRHGKRLRRWSLGPSKDKALWSADTLSSWLLDACKYSCQVPIPRRFQLDVAQPPKGFASAANAIGARLTDIRYIGGWSTKSTDLTAKYIDFAMLPTSGAHLFFGYLCKGIPYEGC